VIGMEPETTIEDFIKEFNNDSETLNIYDKDGNKITDLSTSVATGMTIKLEVDDTLYDELKIVVRGDLNGDGMVTMTDYSKLKSILLGEIPTFELFLASDVTKDELVTMPDYTLLKSYLLKSIDSLNSQD
ncbi:MAG: dockerin type I repeat-containing protein, partial [Bacilli bacterium]|nr:dockerin type I repeat-containing protein [Bacilli bacterium]